MGRPAKSAVRQITPADRAKALAVVSGQETWLRGHLDRLAKLPAHGNRTLGLDQLFHGLLLAFFDPLARSLRLIEDAGNFIGNLDLPRLARSTTSDALAVFDPQCLRPVIRDLQGRIPALASDDPDLASITRRIIAADGTYLSTLADVTWALKHTKGNGKKQAQVRANVQMDVASWVPQVLSVSGDDGESEPAAFARDLLADVLYVVDRNFVNFAFVKAVLAAGSDLVLRIKSSQPALKVVKSLPLSPADAAAGVVADELVQLTGRDAPAIAGGLWRRVTVVTTNRHGKPEIIQLLSNLTDAAAVPARVIAAIYRLRWQIELFFKWLKCWARMDHLLSTSRNGIGFQLYVAVIAVLLMYVQSGRRVSLYALAALSRVACGQLTLQQAMAVIAKREHERQLNAARQARRRAMKKLA